MQESFSPSISFGTTEYSVPTTPLDMLGIILDMTIKSFTHAYATQLLQIPNSKELSATINIIVSLFEHNNALHARKMIHAHCTGMSVRIKSLVCQTRASKRMVANTNEQNGVYKLKLFCQYMS